MGRILRLFCRPRRICLGGGLESGLAPITERHHSDPHEIRCDSVLASDTNCAKRMQCKDWKKPKFYSSRVLGRSFGTQMRAANFTLMRSTFASKRRVVTISTPMLFKAQRSSLSGLFPKQRSRVLVTRPGRVVCPRPTLGLSLM